MPRAMPPFLPAAPIRLSRALLDDDARFRLHGWLTSRPLARSVYGTLRPELGRLGVTRETDLVIEGFPRSANTYAAAAFRRANGDSHVIAGHLHAISSIQAGAERGLPVIVVVRDPVDAAVSLIQRQPVRAATAVESYIRFHVRLRPWLPDVLVSDFPVTTTSFGSVIDAVNQRHATRFVPYEHSPDNEAWCRHFVTEADRRDQGEQRVETVALPHAGRRSARQPILQAVLREERLVARARDLYAQLREHAVPA
jgi:hypothetical protein